MNKKINNIPVFFLSIVNCQLSIVYYILPLVFCLLSIFPANSQEKESAEVHKTKSSAVIGGVKYYLHTVEKGQTLYAIAKFYGLNVNEIVIENPEAIDGIAPGQILKVPVEKVKKVEIHTDTAHYILHKVEKGQTLYSLSKQYSVSIEKLRVFNPQLSEGLKEGHSIKIPSGKHHVEVGIPLKPVPEKPVVKPIEVKTNPVVNDSVKTKQLTVVDYSGNLREEYNIAFLLPFNAAEANEMDLEKIINANLAFSNKTSVALPFYEGVLMAIDSLKKQKLHANIFVYDIDDNDSLNILNILKKPELASMNLIIGPLYGSSFMPFSKFAKEHSIPIVSPFTQVNKILFNNPFVCKVTPSSTLQVEQMAQFIVDTFQTQNIILVNNGNSKEACFFNAFKSVADEALLKSGRPIADSAKVAKNLSEVQSKLSLSKTNVIVLPTNNQSYVTEFVRSLNNSSDKYKIVLFGLPSWMNFDNLDFDYLNSLSLHIPANNYIDYQDQTTKHFIKNYRDKYKTEPENYVYQGFDIAYYFISRLQKYGSGFLKNLSESKYHGLESTYNFMQFPSESGFENKFVYILKFDNYKLVKAN